MAESLFITGSTGFIGSHFLERLNVHKYDDVFCLVRDKAKAQQVPAQGKIRFIVGSLFDSKLYKDCLASSNVVIHLAAATGKARAEEYSKVNAEGTEFLVEQCKQSGVKNFLYMSTIAVKYRDQSRYFYAQSKKRGEDAVMRSGLNYTILRPTIVLGKQSAAWRNFSTLAKPPLIFLFGDGTPRIQPIYVDDLADAMRQVVEQGIFTNEAFDLGGPEILTLEDFLKRVQRIHNGRQQEPRVVHVPLRYLIPLVSFMERYCWSLLPFNAGQLSVFANDGTIEPNRLFDETRPRMKDVDAMLSLLAGTGQNAH